MQIKKLVELNPNENILKGFINNIDDEKGLLFNSTVEQKNQFTNDYLTTISFKWPEITYDYFEKIIKIIKEGIKWKNFLKNTKFNQKYFWK